MTQARIEMDFNPPATLWNRLAEKIGASTADAGEGPASRWPWREPEWEVAGPGITYKVLAEDKPRERVALMVRLAPGAAYPPHRHAGVEELHLLEGELWIEDRKLFPGDYNRCEPGTSDTRVWSETGCTCILITSPQDVLR